MKGKLCSILVVAAVAIAGCQKSGPKTTQVEGTVTYKGQPVEKALVMFSPVQPGQGMPASGQTDAQGKFTLWTNDRQGVVPGEYVVTISKSELVPTGEKIPKPEGGMEDVMTTKELLPIKYKLSSSSPLKERVEAGKKNEFKFDLQD